MLPNLQFENRTLHGTVASQISAALSEDDGLPEDEDHRQAESLDDNVAVKIEDLDGDVLLEDIAIFTAPSESDDLREDEGHRQVETFDFLHYRYFPRVTFSPVFLSRHKIHMFTNTLEIIRFTGSVEWLRPSVI